MREVIFDIEVYPNWWVVVHTTQGGGLKVISSDDADYMRALAEMRFGNTLFGFNIKGYDLRILHLIVSGGDPKDVYELSQAIIYDGDHRFNNYYYWNKFTFSDLMDDWRFGSLKEFESNMGMSIVETSIPFDKENLTMYDKFEIIEYCKYDVKATVKLLEYRREYVDAKIILAEEFGLNKTQALKSTVAKLGSLILGATKRTYQDDPIFEIPKRVEHYIRSNLPENVIDMFKYLDDENRETFLFDNNVVFGSGGIHSTVGDNIIAKEGDDYLLVNFDVTSYYPMLMITYNYLSRNIKDDAMYKRLYDMSTNLKTELSIEWDERKSKLRNALKLILNASYGAMKNEYNALYDPHRATSMCYLGQLLLAALSQKIYNNGGKIIQTNTDGVLVKVKRDNLNKIKLIVKEWENITGLTMENEEINVFFQRDVNNYIELKKDGSVKLKGKWANQAHESMANLNAPIAHKALLQYYINNTPIENTVYESNDPMDFCFTTKTGRSYDKTYHYINNEPRIVNKVNRVMATTNKSFGTIKKIKTIENRADKIAEIPENSIIMNDELYIPDTLDREWYVGFANNKLKELKYV